MFRFIRTPVLIASLLLGTMAVSSVAMADPPAAQPAQQQQAGHHGRRHHGGRGEEGMVDYALRNLTLSEGQRAQLEQLKTSTRPSREAARAAHKDLMAALAPEVAANTVNASSLQAKVAAIAVATANERVAHESTVDQLHAILDTSQRADLANALEARMNAREQAREQRESAAAQSGTPAAPRAPGRRLARELQLTPAQEQAVAAVMQSERSSQPRPDFAAMKAERTAMLEGFKGASFSASHFTSNDGAARAKAGTERFIDTQGKIAQILTPEQRATAAQKMEARATHTRPSR